MVEQGTGVQAAHQAQLSEAYCSLSFLVPGAEHAGAYMLRADRRHPAAGSPQPPGTRGKGECHGAAGLVDGAPPAPAQEAAA